MTVAEFMAKWKRSDLKERSAEQEHFIDLAHHALDAAAYGWPADLTDDQVLERMLDLNVTRSETGDIGGPHEG